MKERLMRVLLGYYPGQSLVANLWMRARMREPLDASLGCENLWMRDPQKAREKYDVHARPGSNMLTSC